MGGEDCKAVTQLREFETSLKRVFGTKIIFAVNQKLQNYLRSYRMVENRSEVDDSILNLKDMTNRISD